MTLERILSEVSVDAAYATIEEITEGIPSRLAGSENSFRMAQYAKSKFEKTGLQSQLHQFLGLVSFPHEGLVRILGAQARDIVANTLGHSASTDGLEAELVYVGSGAESDYEGKDVRGKITLSELSYRPARHEKAYVAWKRGAAGAIMMNWGDETNEAVPFGSMKSAWGNPTPETYEAEMPDLPCVGIAQTEGLKLKAMCAAGTVRVRIEASADNGYKPLAMTTGEMAADAGRQFLLVGGHMDSWPGPQATDNAAGDACMMELARVFARHQDDLRRGLVIGLWMGHETGTMISSSRYADVNWDRLRRSCVGYLQIDQPAITGSSVWHLHSTDDLQSYIMRSTREATGGMPIKWERQLKNGDSSFFGVGLPACAGEMSFTDEEIARTALASLGWWHHSLHNTIDKVDKELLAKHLRLYGRWMWDLMTAPILPLEYRPVASRFYERVAELAALEVPEVDMEGTLEQAKVFLSQAERLDEACQLWAGRVGSAEAESVAEALNGVMIRLSRLLIPIASTAAGSYGQDRYGHTWQTSMIPSLARYPMLMKLPADSEGYQQLWVAMVRARNELTDVLAAASSIVSDFFDGQPV